MKKLLAVDGNSILNRAFYGVRPLTTMSGLHTNAVFGMMNILRKHIEALTPDYAAVAFDVHAPTFRHLEYDQYKAGRKPMPPELAMQLPYAKRLCEALGFTVIEKEGYEADDILGTLSVSAVQEGMQAFVLTGDRDSLQLINENCTVLLASTGDTVTMGVQEFFEKYGIPPQAFVDAKAIMGDSSDNIPGVAGIGEKGAMKLLCEFGSLDGIYENLDAKSISDGVRKKLTEGKESAYMSQSLARIFCYVPMEKELSELVFHGLDKKAMLELCTELEFRAAIDKLGLLDEECVCDQASDTAEIIDFKEISKEELKTLSKDTLWALSLEDGVLYLSSEQENYCLPCPSWSDAQNFFDGKSFCIFDSKPVIRQLHHAGISAKGCAFDITLAAYLLASESSHSLEALSSAYLKATLPSKGRSAALLSLSAVLREKLDETGQLKLLLEVEIPLAYVLADMENVGFKVDLDGLSEFSAKLDSMISQSMAHIYELAGCEFNINSPKQLGEVLFDKLDLPAVKKTKTGYSTNAEVLEKLRPYHPIIDQILSYRQVAKLKSTYAEGLAAAADNDGRVHSTFNQTVTATGRLSSTEPNLQNIPVRTELGREMRKFFVAENQNYILIDADYSQIELRLLAAISGDENMINTFIAGGDIHTSTAAQVFGVAPEDVTDEMRKRAKAVNFGIVYGIGSYSLSLDIGVSKKQADEYIKSYLSHYPAVDGYLKDIVRRAHEDGYVSTLLGRRRYIPELTSQKAALRSFGERVAMNSPIQGTAADIIKLAMVNTDRALKEAELDARIILQVHDELIIEANINCKEQAEKILCECMEKVIELPVPLTVSSAVGNTWFEAK